MNFAKCISSPSNRLKPTAIPKIVNEEQRIGNNIVITKDHFIITPIRSVLMLFYDTKENNPHNIYLSFFSAILRYN